MYSFKKEVKILNENIEEQTLTYEFYYFTQPVTSPRIVKYSNYGGDYNFNLTRYNNDFLGLHVHTAGMFYIEYTDALSENYKVYDGSYLMFENMTHPFDTSDNRDETLKLEMPKHEIENRNPEFKIITYQTSRNYFTTLYYINTNLSGMNRVRTTLTLPKELQIKEFLEPQEITQSDFLELINGLQDDKDIENVNTNNLYKVVDDNDSEIVISFNLLSYTKNNIINKQIDYISAIKNIQSYGNFFNTYQYLGGGNSKLIFTMREISNMWGANFYYGITNNAYDNRNPSHYPIIYDGYNGLISFYGTRNYHQWDNGYLQDYRTQDEVFSSVQSLPDISIKQPENEISERVSLIVNNSLSNL